MQKEEVRAIVTAVKMNLQKCVCGNSWNTESTGDLLNQINVDALESIGFHIFIVEYVTSFHTLCIP